MSKEYYRHLNPFAKTNQFLVLWWHWKDLKKACERFWDALKILLKTFKTFNACAYRMYLRYLWTVTMVFLLRVVSIEKKLQRHHFCLALNCPNKIHDSTFTLPLGCLTCPYMLLPNSANPVAWTCSSSTCLIRPLSGSSASASAPFSTTSEGASPVSFRRATFLLAPYSKMTFTDLRKFTYLLPAISCVVLHT